MRSCREGAQPLCAPPQVEEGRRQGGGGRRVLGVFFFFYLHENIYLTQITLFLPFQKEGVSN